LSSSTLLFVSSSWVLCAFYFWTSGHIHERALLFFQRCILPAGKHFCFKFFWLPCIVLCIFPGWRIL
jgi:hypothetical protein